MDVVGIQPICQFISSHILCLSQPHKANSQRKLAPPAASLDFPLHLTCMFVDCEVLVGSPVELTQTWGAHAVPQLSAFNVLLCYVDNLDFKVSLKFPVHHLLLRPCKVCRRVETRLEKHLRE